jgi:hypothetical protein
MSNEEQQNFFAGTPKQCGKSQVTLERFKTPTVGANSEDSNKRKKDELSPGDQGVSPEHKIGRSESAGNGSEENLECENVTYNGTINNAILAYIAYSMQSGTLENTKKVVIRSFNGDQIIEAKNELWEKCDANIIGKKVMRQSSPTRSAEEANAVDILNALGKLDQKGVMPDIVISAVRLGEIPRIHPEELNAISVVQRVQDMEVKTDRLQECIESIIRVTTVLKQQISERRKKDDSITVKADHGDWNDMVIEEFDDSSWLTADGSKKESSEFKSIYQSDKETKSQSFAEVARKMGVTGASSRGRGSGRGRRGGSQGFVTSASNTSLKPPNPDVRRLRGSNVSLDERSESSLSDDSFRLPSYQQRRNQRVENKRRNFIEGKSKVKKDGCAFKGAPEPSRHLFIYRVDSETQTIDLKTFIGDHGFDVRELNLVSHKESMFKSFKLTVPVSQFKDLFEVSLWPSGVRVRKYITPRTNEEVQQ